MIRLRPMRGVLTITVQLWANVEARSSSRPRPTTVLATARFGY